MLRRQHPIGFTLAITVVLVLASTAATHSLATENENEPGSKIILLDPPQDGFFAKELFFHGIPVKAPAEVADEAIYEARNRIARELKNLPQVTSNLVAAGVEVHIIGHHQVTSDLPEFRNLKGKPLPEYQGKTIDERTRGMGGRLTSCGEENLLKLPNDHYFGRDILVHEFAHAIRQYGISLEVVQRFNEQYHRSLDKGLWKGAYAASNADEFFAELSMWYFGTHGDEHMTGPKPADGPDGLKQYDPEAYQLFDDFYSGRIEIGKMQRGHPWTSNSSSTNRPPRHVESD